LLSDLLSTPPVDLVTSIESTKQLLQDRQAIAPAAQRPVYVKAIRHLESMVPLARERTKALQQVARSSRFESRLDRPDSSPASSFFTAPVARRWQELAAQWRPALDRSFVELRRAEAQWSAVGPGVPALRPAGTPVYIRPAPERMNPLDRGSYYR
jgi:hypothetical protein